MTVSTKRSSDEEREFLTRSAMRFYHLGHLPMDYRTAVIEYRFLLAEKREKKLPLHKLSEKVLAEIPEIPFLRELDDDSARAYLDACSITELKALLYDLENLQCSYAWNTLHSRIVDYRYELDHYGEKHSSLMVDPDACSGGHRSRSRAASSNLIDES